MKYPIILACVYTFAAAHYHETRSAWSDLLGNSIDIQSSLLRRNDINLSPRSRTLLRRGDSKQHSRSGGGNLSRIPSIRSIGKPAYPVDPIRPGSPTRFGSPSARSRITAEGPASMRTENSGGRQHDQVAEGATGVMNSVDQIKTAAWATSNRREAPPGGQVLRAEAKGKTVDGMVIPPSGGTGRITVESNQGKGVYATHHVPGGDHSAFITSTHPGGAMVKATVDQGGLAIASASNYPYSTAFPPNLD